MFFIIADSLLSIPYIAFYINNNYNLNAFAFFSFILAK